MFSSLINPPRRRFLKLTLSLLTLPFLPAVSNASPHEDLVLYIVRNGAKHSVPIYHSGQINEEGYLRLCYILKDIHADAAVKMDPQLFVILARGQQWLASHGYTKPLIITSAYRSPLTNHNTEGAARNSLHQYGRAIDLKYPGLPISYLAVVFRTFGAAGIGIYDTFLHVDTWKERAWVG